jgi:hypothetical protein
MFQSVGLPVEELSRRRYGPLTDKGLEPGGFRELGGDEVEALRRAGEEVAGAVAKEDEGVPVLLAAEAQPGSETANLDDVTSGLMDADDGVSGEPDVAPETREG